MRVGRRGRRRKASVDLPASPNEQHQRQRDRTETPGSGRSPPARYPDPAIASPQTPPELGPQEPPPKSSLPVDSQATPRSRNSQTGRPPRRRWG
jgi:hypothetical protein